MKSKLRIVPKAWFSWDFGVLRGGVERAVLHKSWLREHGTFTIDGETCAVARTSMLRRTFSLEHDGRVLAKARKPNLFFRSFEIEAGEDTYRLQAASPFRRAFLLLRRQSVVGEIAPVAPFRREAEASLPQEMEEPLQLFTIFLVLVLWRRATHHHQ